MGSASFAARPGLCWLLLSFAARVWAADVLAPLPPGVAASDATPVRGIYAEETFGDTQVLEQVRELERACAARGSGLKIEGIELQWSGRKLIYRAGESVAVYEDRPQIAANVPDCTAKITLRHSVKAGPWSVVRPGEWINELPQCTDSDRRWRPRQCREETVIGIKAVCKTLGDSFQGRVTCYSARDDLSRGLMLSFETYTDTPSGDDPPSGWELDRVLVDALIDPVVFQQ